MLSASRMFDKLHQSSLNSRILTFDFSYLQAFSAYCIAYLLLPLIGGIDALTGPDYTFTLIYLLPVTMVCWVSTSRISALSIIIFSAIVWNSVDFISNRIMLTPMVFAWNMFSRCVVFLLFAVMLFALKSSICREREISRRDPLTNTYNLRAFRDIAEHELSRCRRDKKSITMAFVDIDNFKTVNDTRGHKAGDILLQQVANAIRSSLRESDILARIGGDEFAILLSDCNAQAAQEIGLKLKNSVDLIKNGNKDISLSIGTLTCKDSYPDMEALIKICDELMYSVKKSGKNGMAASTR